MIEYLYWHFPFCRHLCNYCDFYKKIPESPSELEQYHQLLERSYERLERWHGELGVAWSPLQTLYLGGGTPSLWGRTGADFLRRFMIEKNLKLTPNAEVTLEVNPGSWDHAGLNAWQEFGVNRFSLGVQSLDQNFLKLLDRVHSLDEAHETLREFKRRGANFSVDFMLGLPYSQEYERSIESELEQILAYQPDHLSLYILTVPKHYKWFEQLPSEEWIEAEFLTVSSYLSQRGYEHYEVSNFAKPGKRSVHNMAYWEGRSVAALGPSATGYMANAGLRYKWKTTEADFTLEQLNEEQLRMEQVYTALRTANGLDASQIPASLVDRWKELGYLTRCSRGKIQLNAKGYLMLDSIMDDLFSSKVL